MSANGLKAAAIVAFASLGAFAPAHAATFGTRCDHDGDRCYAVRCDDGRENCERISEYRYASRPRIYTSYRTGRISAYHTSYVCDADGDNCYWDQHPIHERRIDDSD